jgi:acetolactate synthase-1/2/3 large subunit
MKASDCVVDFFIRKGITDVFGIPGNVVLDLLYSLYKRRNKILTHLSYHEQAAAFAACGYAQVSGKPGVAYATKGPGFTNLITGVADSYHNSIPVIFITAHARESGQGLRFEQNQELDTVRIVKCITKYAVRITEARHVIPRLVYAYELATSGRPGPVLLDFQADVFSMDLEMAGFKSETGGETNFDSSDRIIDSIKMAIRNAKRPVLLLGDGINQSGTRRSLEKLAQNIKLPIISSRFSQDIISDSEYYFGYIGSHGLRYSNFILSKCDLIIALGNRLAYDPLSESFKGIAGKAKIIRIDIDKNEFKKDPPNTINFYTDLKIIMPILAAAKWQIVFQEWVLVCDNLKDALYAYDADYPVNILSRLMERAERDIIMTSDVGNNEMWLSRAYIFSKAVNRMLYSNTFGSLGCSLPKAIGAYYAGKKRVLCFTGDQGFQMNLQELQFVIHEKLPILMVILNNGSSGMIRDRQKERFGSNFVHTTWDSGYSPPDFKAVAAAFGIHYFMVEDNESFVCFDELFSHEGPAIMEIRIDESIDVKPKLPRGYPCQDFEPRLERKLYNYLDSL